MAAFHSIIYGRFWVITKEGVFHINAVDEVSEWQSVAATERISEAWLLPV